MDIKELLKSVRAIIDAKIAAREARRHLRRGKPKMAEVAFEADLCRCLPPPSAIEEVPPEPCSSSGPGIVRQMRRLPDDIKVPSPEPRPPNLHAANLSFAARLVIAVRDRFGNDAPKVYGAAGVSRQAYSQIISDETRPVSKRTAVRFAFALKYTPEEARLLLKSAGYAFSNSRTEDFILQACLEANPPIWDLDLVNLLLREYRVDFQY